MPRGMLRGLSALIKRLNNMSLTATRSAKVINIFWKMMSTFNFYLKAPIQIYNPLFQLASDNGNGFLQNNQC